MKLNCDVLGNHISLIDIRNKELATERLLGINIDKYFMPSVANVIGTDLSKYKLISKGIFACNPMHVGRDDRLPVALYNEESPAIVSPAYFMFEIIDKSILNEDFLMMWFRRAEFDRICCLRTDGSVRGGISWDDICRIELPVPDYEKQLRIVDSYKVISDRIALKRHINDNLEATAQAIFDELFLRNNIIDDTACQLSDLAFINPNRALKKDTVARCFEMATLPIKGCVPSGYDSKPYIGGMRFMNGDTIMARITPCLENGKAAYINILNDNEVAFGSTEYIIIAAMPLIPKSFFYFLVRNSAFINYAVSQMNGSSGRQRVSGIQIAAFRLNRPTSADLQKFDALGSQTLEQIKVNSLEIIALERLQHIMLSQLSDGK